MCVQGLGRMVNDAKAGNCKMKKVVIDDVVHLCSFAVTSIAIGDQLLFNYGDTEYQLFWRQKVGSVSIILHESDKVYNMKHIFCDIHPEFTFNFAMTVKCCPF